MKNIFINNKSKLYLKYNNLVISSEDGNHEECLDTIVTIIINKGSIITTDLINELGNKNIHLIILNEKNNPTVSLVPTHGTINMYESVKKQIVWNINNMRNITLTIIKNKIINQQTLINELFNTNDSYKEYIDVISINNMNLNEAFVALKYFYKLFGSSFNRRIY